MRRRQPPRFFLARFGPGACRRLQPRLRQDGRIAMPASSACWSARWIALVAMLAVFAGLIYATVYMAQTVPRGFIPTLDQGYAIVVVQLPDGASLSRTDAVVQRASEIIQNDAGRRQRRRLRRLLRRDLHQRQQCRRDLRARSSRSTSGSRPGQSAAAGHRRLCSAACRASRKPSSSRCRRRRSAASAMPAASRCSCRSATAPTCGQILAARLRDRRQGQPDAGADRRLHHLLGVEPAILPGDRPRQGAHAERADPQHLRDAVDQSRHGLRQRLQRVRPRLPGARAGRPGIPARARRHPEAEGALGDRRAGAARHAGRDPRRDRPDAGAALQHVRLGAAAGQRRARRLDRPGARR